MSPLLLCVFERGSLFHLFERNPFLSHDVTRMAAQVSLYGDPNVLVPFTQTHIADKLGLFLVHTNENHTRFQQRSLIEWVGKSCPIDSLDDFMAMANWEGLPENERPLI